MSDDELLVLIARQTLRAAVYGVDSERDVAKWCFLAVLTAERFDRAPEIAAFLSDKSAGTPRRKMHTLMMSLAYAAKQKGL